MTTLVMPAWATPEFFAKADAQRQVEAELDAVMTARWQAEQATLSLDESRDREWAADKAMFVRIYGGV